MKTLHSHHGSKRRKLAQHAHSRGSHASRIHSHTYIDTVTTMWCEPPAQLLQNVESNFYFEGT